MEISLNKIFLLFLLLCLSSCTKPISQLVEERKEMALLDDHWFQYRLDFPGTLEFTLDQAIEFALEYNLDLRVQEAQVQVAGDAIGRELIQMLPDLNVSTLYSRRNNLPSSILQSVDPAIPIPPFSFGALQSTNTWNVDFAWNILNTGIQYFGVKEAKNTQLAQEFLYQRTAQNLIQSVVSTYWLVATMQESERKIDELTVISRDLAVKLRAQVEEGHIALQQATELIGRIYYQQVQAKLFLLSYQGAIDQFKGLLGIPPNVHVILQAPKELTIPGSLPPPNQLHMIALTHRPELYQADLQMAIYEDELRAAILEIFPALSPFIDFTWDANPFLAYNYWASCGFKTLYNLLSIPLSINDQMTAEDQIRLARAQRVALSISILSQIHVAYALYQDALDRFKDAKIYWEAKKNSYELALAKKNLHAIGDLDYVFPLSDLGYAETQMNLFYVQMMGYLEQINNAIGIPRYFTVDSLAGSPTEENQK
jgi:outer membrane protein TolC